jgi:rifampicin phosphotransferase
MFIAQRQDKNLQLKQIGGKAYSLYNLNQVVDNIPPWFAITSQSAQEVLTDEGQKELFIQELQNNLLALGTMDDLWAVRSSACEEDGAQHSFAGQLDTFLFVSFQDVFSRIVDVWNSIHSEHIQTYIKEKNIHHVNYPAVLVQKMVNAQCAGVAFAINPVNRKKETVISSVWGLGNALVSGHSDADTWTLNAKGIKTREIAHKTSMEILDTQTGHGTIMIDVPAEKQDSNTLEDYQLLSLHHLITQVSEFYNHPQDIEWAMENNTLYLLQSRPVTTVYGNEILWDNSNIAESYGGVTTPLTFSFASRAYEAVYRELCLLLRIPKKKVANHDKEFRTMLGLIHGRVFYNMNSWYKTLALLPGFSLNHQFMEQMMGVKQGMSEELMSEIQQSVTQSKVLDIKNLLVTISGLTHGLFTIKKTVNDFYQRLDEALAPRNLEQMSLSELVAYYNELEGKLLKQWDAPMVNDLFAMIFYGLLKKLSHQWCDDQFDSLQNSLILGEGGIISAEPAALMKKISAKLYAKGIIHEDFQQWTNLVNQQDDIVADIHQYLGKFGDRCLDELKLESITLSDNPELLYKTLYELTMHYRPDMSNQDTQAREQRQQLEKQIFGKLPFLKRKIFQWVLTHTRNRVKERENLRFERTRLFGRVRRIFLAIGKRLVESHLIQTERDIFYLEITEILALAEGTSTLLNLKELIRLRKTEFAEYEQMEPLCDRFTTHGMVYFNNSYQSEQQDVIIDSNTHQGLGCCPGIVKGKVKVVRDPRNVVLEKGVILVAERTDPGWIMLFPSASALLVERGSLLSHAAIVARELNLPAVVSVSGLMNWLKDDDIVEMDGTTGRITVLQRASENEVVSLIKATETYENQ